MLSIIKTRTSLDTVQFYQLLKDLFGGTIFYGFDVIINSPTSVQISKGRIITQNLDIIDLDSNIIYDIISENSHTKIKDGNHLLVVSIINNKPKILLIQEQSKAVYKRLPSDFVVIGILVIKDQEIKDIIYSYINHAVKRIGTTINKGVNISMNINDTNLKFKNGILVDTNKN